MVFLNYTTMQMTAKIVYYGPGLCGKTTNLQFIHQKTAPKSRGEMVSLETETDRTLFFDLLPLDVGVVGGMKVRLQLYTVPGQVFYNATRKLVLRNVDGVVYVADSQKTVLDANIESLGNLEENLAELGLGMSEVPIVMQYNKRDLRDILSVDELNQALNPGGFPHFEAAALHGVGVFETLKGISRLTLHNVREKARADVDPKKLVPPKKSVVVPAPPQPPPKPAPAPVPSRSAAGRAIQADDPLAALVGGSGPKVEFAEEDSDPDRLRAVKTKGQVDVHRELEKLRKIAAPASTRGRARASEEVEQRLKDIVVAETQPRAELRRKAALSVPGTVLAGASSVRVQLVFEGADGNPVVTEVVTVPMPDSRRGDGFQLDLSLDVKGQG